MSGHYRRAGAELKRARAACRVGVQRRCGWIDCRRAPSAWGSRSRHKGRPPASIICSARAALTT